MTCLMFLNTQKQYNKRQLLPENITVEMTSNRTWKEAYKVTTNDGDIKRLLQENIKEAPKQNYVATKSGVSASTDSVSLQLNHFPFDHLQLFHI